MLVLSQIKQIRNSDVFHTCIHMYMNNTKAEKDLFDKMNNCVWYDGGTREE